MLKVLLFVNLLYVVNQVHFPWETGIPGVAVANIIFVLILLAMRGKPDQIDTPGILRKPVTWFYYALLFAFLIAQLRGLRDPIADLTYLKNAVFFPLFYFLYLRCRQDLKGTRQLIIWVMVIAAVAGLEAFREGFDYGFGKYNPFRRASGPFGVDWHHANRAGVFFGMFFPMFVALALFLRNQKRLRLAAIIGIVLLAGGALATYSRQAYLLLLLGSALLLLRRSVVASVAVAVLCVSLVGYLPDAVTARVEETQQQSATGEAEVDVSTASRWEIWAGAMGMFRDHPLGAGLNRFKTEIGAYCKYKGMDAHNFYVLTLAETGPQGLITLLIFFVSLFRLAKFLRQNVPEGDSESQALAVGFTITTLNMMLGGLYGSPHFEGSVMGPYWALCGLLERYTILKQGGAGQSVPQTKPPSLVERFPLAAHILPGKN